MSKFKLNSVVVFVPSKYFPQDSIGTGKIIQRCKSGHGVFMYWSYQILWDDGKSNHYFESNLETSQFRIFSDQKKALAFILMNS